MSGSDLWISDVSAERSTASSLRAAAARADAGAFDEADVAMERRSAPKQPRRGHERGAS